MDARWRAARYGLSLLLAPLGLVAAAAIVALVAPPDARRGGLALLFHLRGEETACLLAALVPLLSVAHTLVWRAMGGSHKRWRAATSAASGTCQAVAARQRSPTSLHNQTRTRTERARCRVAYCIVLRALCLTTRCTSTTYL